MQFILILMMHVGPMGSGNSNALTTAQFDSRTACEYALAEAKKLAINTVKEIRGVCAPKGL